MTNTITAASDNTTITGMTTERMITVTFDSALTAITVATSAVTAAGILHLAATVTGLRLKIFLSPSVPSKPMSRVSLSN
jgi:hypothetical protein